ncbi:MULTISPECIES: DUF424 domain-containing protein [Halococcus]|uniref:DUF424 domain-containing protein n=1 Tax=Halococcus salifodinae DSM 8989 TaxID=1227456 RepID=M0NE11_9EURY|nr:MULTISPECIES: DUF424 domain-containing protein [Halococcus]EMA55329.1 hypothetical protein C450_02965 [Halococcus salifodinae DSM 8989]
MIVNERETPEGRLVSVCDPEVLGETFENGDLDFEVSEEFYDGEPADEEDVVASLAGARVANIVGCDAVALAVEHGFVDEESVLDLGDTRHAQLLRLE